MSSKQIEILYKNIERYDCNIEKADNKASFMLAFFGAMFIGIVTNYIAIYSEVIKLNKACRIFFNIIYMLLLLSVIIHIHRTFNIINPRIGRREKDGEGNEYRSVMFFEDVKGYNIDEYEQEIKSLDDDDIINELSIQAIELSKICSKKMRGLNRTKNISNIIIILTIITFLSNIGVYTFNRKQDFKEQTIYHLHCECANKSYL